MVHARAARRSSSRPPSLTLFAALLATGALAAQTLEVIAGGGVGDGGPAIRANLAGPEGVAVDGHGNLYIADSSNHRIRKVSPDGIITTILDGLRFPVGVAVAPDGRIYVADTYNHRVLAIPAEVAAAGLNLPSGVAIDGVGNLYIADSGASRVVRVAADRTVHTVARGGRIVSVAVDSFGKLFFTEPDRGRVSPLAGRFEQPFGLAFDRAGNLFVSEERAGRILKVAPSGARATVASGLHSPQGLAVDGAGNIYVAEFGRHRVQRIAPDGSVLTAAGNGEPFCSGDGGPAANAALNLPQGIALDAAGSLWIADAENHRVRKVSPSGVISTVAAGLARPLGVAVDAAGNLYIADTNNQSVRRVTPDGVTRAVAEGLNLPGAVAVGPAGELFIADSGNRRVLAMSRSGQMRTALAGLRAPAALAVDARGNLWIADRADGSIRRLSSDGRTETVVGPGVLARPLGLALGVDGNLYVAETDRSRVVSISPDRKMRVVASGFQAPFGLAVDSQGRLLVADSLHHRVVRVTPAPSAETPLPPITDESTSAAAPLSRSLAPYVATPAPVIDRMLDMARVTASDTLFDLGSGDGAILIAAGRRGARAVGIELDRDLVELARRRIRDAKLDPRARIIHGDLLETDLSQATVVTLYLLPEHMPKVRDALERRLRPGARIVSHDAAIEGWRAVETATVIGEAARVHTLYLYVLR